MQISGLTLGIMIPVLAIYVVLLLIFYRLGDIKGLLKDIRDLLREGDSNCM